MSDYKFLLKPVFFIFNLLFATWLVFEIEKLSPSDFGRYSSWFEDPPKLNRDKMIQKEMLKKLCIDYKMGVLDSTKLDQSLESYLLEAPKGLNK